MSMNSKKLRPTLTVGVIATIAAAGVLACSNESPGSAGSSADESTPAVRDSMGVEIVEVPGDMLKGLPKWGFSEEPLLSLGAVQGDQPYLLHRVFAAWRLNSGEIVVADGASLEFRVFGRDGKFRRAIGGKGGGPGEFRGFPLTVSQSDNDRIAVYDDPLERVTAIDLRTGESTTRSQPHRCREPHEAEPGPCQLESLLADGTVFAYRTARGSPAPAGDELVVVPGPPRYYGSLSADTLHVFDSIASPTGVRIGQGADLFSGTALFEPGGATATGSAEMVFGDPYAYELRIREGASGELARIIRVSATPTPVTGDLLRQYRTWADTASNIPAVSREYLASVEPEGTVPFFDELLVDRAGRIWVQDYRPFWAFGPRELPAWTIYREDGVPLARVEGGSPGAILEVGNDYALVRETDELDVEYVRMYRIGPVDR